MHDILIMPWIWENKKNKSKLNISFKTYNFKSCCIFATVGIKINIYININIYTFKYNILHIIIITVRLLVDFRSASTL